MADNSLFSEIERHLTRDEKPSEYLESICERGKLQNYPFNMLSRMRQTEQSPKHHPEGNVWNHTLLVVDEAAKVKSKSGHPKAFMWAALLHDIGKPSTTRIRKGRITAYSHDAAGSELAREFLSCFVTDGEFINRVCGLILYHMQILYVAKDLPYADIPGMTGRTDINEVAMLGLCDRLGRTGANEKLERGNIDLFLKKVKEGNNEMKPNPDDRSNNVGRIQRNIDMTIENIRRANDAIDDASDPKMKQTLREKNQRREQALDGMRNEIRDEAAAEKNNYQ